MQAFLFPHRLMAPKELYIAALHRDAAVARAAFMAWAGVGAGALDLEKVSYHQHKLVSLIVRRFACDLDLLAQAGVLHNIARQGRFRAHAQLALLRAVLQADGMGGTGLIAIGALREHLLAPADRVSDLDRLELCLPLSTWAAGLAVLGDAGWQPKAPPHRAWGRNALIAEVWHAGGSGPVRLLGLPVKAGVTVPVQGYAGLQVLADGAHGRFLGTRAVSLLLRRDQGVFDIFCAAGAAAQAGGQAAVTIADLPWWFRGKASAVLGLNAGF